MKKIFILLLLALFSCKKEAIEVINERTYRVDYMVEVRNNSIELTYYYPGGSIDTLIDNEFDTWFNADKGDTAWMSFTTIGYADCVLRINVNGQNKATQGYTGGNYENELISYIIK